MKKLLAMAISTGALAALAVDVATVGVTEVTTTNQNTIVAVPFEKLGGGDIDVHDIVKTTGLPVGTQLFVFNGSSYTAWTIDQGTPNKWTGLTTASKVDGVDILPPQSTEYNLAAGSAIWLVLPTAPAANTPQKFIVYGAYKTGVTSKVVKGANLVANPLQGKAEFVYDATDGDTIVVPNDFAAPKYYYYGTINENKCWYSKGEGRFAKPVVGAPVLEIGRGFWYVSKNADDGEMSWKSWSSEE